jgi:HlyD family secretion protein
MRTTPIIILTSALLFLVSCKNEENNFDASGAFESVETIISTEATGTIMQFNIEEGQTLQDGQKIGYIDP